MVVKEMQNNRVCDEVFRLIEKTYMVLELIIFNAA